MKARLKLHLKSNERLFIKVDRKVAIELLNDVMFLLESHVMPPEEATTPLRRLYFAVQSMIIEPAAIVLARQIYDQQHHELIATFKDVEIQEGLMAVRGMIERTRVYEALKLIRKLFEIERRALDAANMASGRVVA